MAIGADDIVVMINGNAVPLLAAINQATAGLNQLQNAADQTGAHAGGMGNVFSGILGTLGQFAEQIGHVIETMVLWRSLDFVTSMIQEWTSALFDLNNTMERTQTSWEYLFGTGNNATSQQMAQGLADWTKTASYSYPFTRQDMLGAINAAGMATNDPNLIKQYLPDIADIASTRTNFAGQPVTLQQAMYSLSMANEGQSRMLKYDLKINPEDLKKYGWDENAHDFSNLLQALDKYNKAHNLTGAAQTIATTTWFGEWSSFEDRIQNLQLLLGQGVFENLKGDLNQFTEWWDAHQTQINAIGTWLANDLAGGIRAVSGAARDFSFGAFWGDVMAVPGQKDPKTGKTVGAKEGTPDSTLGYMGAIAHGVGADALNLVEKLGQGLQKGGALEGIYNLMKGISEIANNPATKEYLGDLATIAGITVGSGLQALGWAIKQIGDGIAWMSKTPFMKQVLKDISDAMTDLGKSLGDLGKALPPGTVDLIGHLLFILGAGIVLAPLAMFLGLLKLLSWWAEGWAWGLGMVGRAFDWLGTTVHNILTPIGQFRDRIVEAITHNKTLQQIFGDVISIMRSGKEIFDAVTGAVGRFKDRVIEGIEKSALFRAVMQEVKEKLADARAEWDRITTAASNLREKFAEAADQIRTKILDLLSQARQWGQHLIQNLIDGITDKIGDLTQAVSNIANKIKGLLGHSVPREGPLKDELTWMPHMMQNLATGITANVPLVARASQTAASAVAAAWNGAGVSGSGGVALSGGSGPSVSYGDSSVTQHIYAPSTTEVQRLIATSVARTNQQSALAAMMPGGYMRYGNVG